MSVSPLPSWVKRSIGKASETSAVQQVIKQRGLHTICEEGRCPNRAECYSQKTATFLLMGGICTRACSFCQVASGRPAPLDPAEPEKVAEAVELLGLRYVVLTSVARDDLPDQGSGRFVEVMEAIRRRCPGTQIEVLTPDFRGDRECIARVVAAQPVCYNHNIETVRRLSQAVRRSSGYDLVLAGFANGQGAESRITHQVWADAGAWGDPRRSAGNFPGSAGGGMRPSDSGAIPTTFLGPSPCGTLLDSGGVCRAGPDSPPDGVSPGALGAIGAQLLPRC